MHRNTGCSITRRAAIAGAAALASIPCSTARADDPPRRYMVFGDSQAQGLAGGFLRRFRGDRQVRILDRSKISTGLIPRANFDWPKTAQTISAERPDVAVAMFGANDRPPVRIGHSVDEGLLARFQETYGARVANIAADFRSNEVKLIWVGHPIVRDPAFDEDMSILNAIYENRAVAEGALFLPTADAFRGPDGRFSLYGKGLDGQTTRLRADDGVHMTPAGYDVIASMVLPLIET